ncbi:PREDICTED: oxysterol-binding protein-related protein 4B-like [Tarenaya hassleriana]|uniref:oxysterol-binding protein-related protein 4B-like n=1 Tax=Tarenaya hassleriana TaxID=28532 RepID=UPI00053C51F1|nr:PREDICTED: oxysterol-binding protein-related protein 4B-like [Tarenaya hassleriana]
MAEAETAKRVVIAKPYSLGDEKDSEYTAPNFLRRILSLFKNVRPGSDLSHFQVKMPPPLNLPKSQLQCYGELVYSFGGQDLLGMCNHGDRPIQRLKRVLTWNISTIRPLIFGMAPYNPLLGETHHVSHAHIHVILEQVSHHPPVSALHAFHEKENIEMIWCQYVNPKFRGAYVEAEVKGKRTMKLLNRGETYEMSSPKPLMRILPVPGAYWTGHTHVKCSETGLEAQLHFPTDSFFGFRGNNRSIKGKIFESRSGKTLYEVYGYWDKTVKARDMKTGEEEVIYNAKDNISAIATPIVQNLKEVKESESTLVWSKVSEAIMAKDWERAVVAKRAVEDRQRESAREREASAKTWTPQHFSVSCNGNDWDCSPLDTTVPPAPIVLT